MKTRTLLIPDNLIYRTSCSLLIGDIAIGGLKVKTGKGEEIRIRRKTDNVNISLFSVSNFQLLFRGYNLCILCFPSVIILLYIVAT